LALALDEPQDTDEMMQIDDFQFVVNKTLSKQYKRFTIDYTLLGFSVTGDMTTARGNFRYAKSSL
jgi:hypothetical protein